VDEMPLRAGRWQSGPERVPGESVEREDVVRHDGVD
jgi:hypothetical protein